MNHFGGQRSIIEAPERFPNLVNGTGPHKDTVAMYCVNIRVILDPAVCELLLLVQFLNSLERLLDGSGGVWGLQEKRLDMIDMHLFE